MPFDSVATVWEAIGRYEGVPQWWAGVFVSIGLSAAEAMTWVETAQCDENSVLCRLREKEMNSTLKSYARARGISLMGVGDGEDAVPAKADHLVQRVSTVITAPEQEAVLAEVSAYADVEFREKINGVYSQHAVANAVRSVHGGYLNRVVGDATVLEAGASIKSAVLAGVDPTKRHCCCPVLDVRDGVRHSIRGWLERTALESSGYREAIRAAARAALDPTSGFTCKLRAQECTKQVEMICSNEATHDIAFDDLPLIMARHGARLWVGFMTRAPGVRAVGGPRKGMSSVLGTRWQLDETRKKITFHFERDGSFSYTHEFSEWIKYEERFGYRWRGQYFDYVYARMPITTQSSLAFVVVRVPKTMNMLREPVYKASHLAGMVAVQSVRAVGGCLGGRTPSFEPFEFALEAIVFDRVLEMRLSQGERGNLASTIAYMRSARVRLIVNGVALGAVTQVPVDVLEPAAVAVEVLAADWRRAGDRDYKEVMRVAASDAAFVRVLRYFTGLTRFVGARATGVDNAVRSALAAVLNGKNPIVVKAERCAPYVRVSDGAGLGDVALKPQLSYHGCGCTELTAVNAALAMGHALGKEERRELLAYAARLKEVVATCEVHDIHRVPLEEAEDAFHDACESWDSASSDTTTVLTGGSSGEEDASSCSSATDACESICAGGLVSREAEPGEGGVMSAMREYASWAQAADQAARTEARVNAEVLFLAGNPTLADVERSTTARTRHAVVAVIGGRVDRAIGTLRDEDDYAEVYVRSLRRTCKVFQDRRGKYLKENVTELCYTSSGLSVMNGDQLCRATVAVMQDLPRGFVFPRYTFVDGVPGCGKTWEIKTLIVAMVNAGKSVMYLTATKASCEHVTRAMATALGPDRVVCKTYDSYLIHGAVPVGLGSVDTLFMDEAPMAHKGELFGCMLKASARDVRMYGDTKQIPWLPFMASFDAEHWQLSGEVAVERRHMTHRFGARTCAMWLDVYGKIYPCDCCEHDDTPLSVVPITSYAGVPKCDDGKVLTFTQEEKVTAKREGAFPGTMAELKNRDKRGLSSVAEDQGGSHDEVFIVRLMNKKNPKESRQSPSIYNRQPWVLVATTRHRKRLVYYTTADEDLVVARMQLSECGVRLEAVKKKKHWDEVKHRAMHVRTFGV